MPTHTHTQTHTRNILAACIRPGNAQFPPCLHTHEEGNPAGLSSCSGGLRTPSSCVWNLRFYPDDAWGHRDGGRVFPGRSSPHPAQKQEGLWVMTPALKKSLSDRSFAAEFEQESQGSSCVEEWNSACLSSCSRGDRSLLELCVRGVLSRPAWPHRREGTALSPSGGG